MSGIKISSLPSTESLVDNASEYLIIVRPDDVLGLKNEKLSLQKLFSSIKSPLIINPEKGSVELEVYGQGNNIPLLISDPNNNRIGIHTDTPEVSTHINGDVMIGGSNPGLLITSSVILPVTTDVGVTTQDIDVTYTTIIIDAPEGAKTSGLTFLLSAPARNGITKTIMYGSKHSSVPTNVSYNIQTSNVANVINIILSRVGDTITFYSYNNKWNIQSYFGSITIN